SGSPSGAHSRRAGGTFSSCAPSWSGARLWGISPMKPRVAGRRITVSQLSADDRLAIHEILATYCHALDLGRWEEFAGLFTDDCRLDFGSLMGVYEGREGVRRFSERIQSLGLFMRHYTTNVVVRGDGERARAESYVLAVTGAPGTSMQTTGRYEDELGKVSGRWRLRVRRALLDQPAERRDLGA